MKEILDILRNKENFNVGNGDYEITLYKYQIDKILDYITNLQEENEELKTENEKLTQLWLDSQEKRRKAIEYISEYRNGWNNWFEFTIEDKLKLLNILQGEDK